MPKPKKYICDNDVSYTHDEVAHMFQSFLDKNPDKKYTGTYKDISYEIELLHEEELDRDYFTYTIHLTPELWDFCDANTSKIYGYRVKHRIHSDGYFNMDKRNICYTFNSYCDMPYNLRSMSVVYSYEDFQTLKTEKYVYKCITDWIDIITNVIDEINNSIQE